MGSAQPARRNRAALRDYYQLKSKPTLAQDRVSRTASVTSVASEVSTSPSTATLTENDTTTSALTAQLDNTDFDAESYISNLLASSSLRDILKVEATLVSEIRNLDGERKALVYDNYSKLIEAVGTIGEMQRGINDESRGGLREFGGLDEKMEGLRQSVKEITTVSQQTKEGDAERRRRRREAKELQRKKDVVKWVLSAPARLKGLLEEGKRSEAENDWTVVKECLDKWASVKGVEDVRSQCEHVMEVSSNEEENETSDG